MIDRATRKASKTLDKVARRVAGFSTMLGSEVDFSERLDDREAYLFRNLPKVDIGFPKVVYDIGAAVGNFSSLFAKMPAVSNVIAFEPLPESFEKLSTHVARLSKVRCLNVALGSETGTANFFVSGSHDSSSLLPMAAAHIEAFPGSETQEVVSVPVERLDDLVSNLSLPLPDFVKIDVQGFELQVLAGGRETLSNANFILAEASFVELYAGSCSFHELYSRLHSWGFRLVGTGGSVTNRRGDQLQVDILFRREA